MLPLIIPGRFGEYYQMLARGQSAISCGELVNNTDAAFLFSLITQEISIPGFQWRGVLTRLGISIPPNFAHVYDIHREIIALIQRGELRLVKIARLENLPVFTTGDGWGFCFIRGPQPHPSTSYSPMDISSFDQAQVFFNALNVSEKELRLSAHRNPALSALLDREENIVRRFIEGLANKDVLAYKVPVEAAAPPVKLVEYLPATTVDRPAPLAPESSNSSASSNAKKSEIVDSAPIEVAVQTDNSRSEFAYERPTAEEIALAKSEGSSSLHIQAREAVARDFLKNNGFTQDQIEDALGASDGSKNGGVDLSKPVEVVNFPPPEKMVQYVKSHGYPGNWFDPLSTQMPEMLGISGETRTLKSFTVVPGSGLKSIAKPVVDNWTNPGNPIATSGGGIQLLVNDETKTMISSINPKGV